MINACAKCGNLIHDGQRVGVWVTATYHILKSTVAYALDKNDLEAEASSMIHEQCSLPEGD